MNNIWILIIIAVSFLITALLGKFMVPYLRKIKYGQTILQIGPEWHKDKQGTPTMGGIMFIVGIIVAISTCIPNYYLSYGYQGISALENPLMIIKIFAGMFMALLYGVVGFLDDYIKVVKKRNLGLTARQKLILQFSIAALYLSVVYIAHQYTGSSRGTSTVIPFIGSVDLGIFYWPIAAVLIVGIVNAVNLTDGIDGLCSSVTFFASVFFMTIASILGMLGLSLAAAAIAGGCLGFLIWNFHPAKIFMGDTGSLFFGGAFAALAFAMDMPILIIPMGIVYIFEMFSVVLQVLYFKLTHGKRLFKMSPIHHHFEMLGWSEFKICSVFSFIEIIAGIISVIIVIYGV